MYIRHYFYFRGGYIGFLRTFSLIFVSMEKISPLGGSDVVPGTTNLHYNTSYAITCEANPAFAICERSGYL